MKKEILRQYKEWRATYRKIFCWIFGHKHLEKICDGCGCVDIMWSEPCLVCDGDYKEEPLDY